MNEEWECIKQKIDNNSFIARIIKPFFKVVTAARLTQSLERLPAERESRVLVPGRDQHSASYNN